MISVIIPVYNAEQYLSRCIDSVLASSVMDFEIILVNDGSTDGSLAICSEYTEKDQRIRLITQENQGVSAARNRGIDESRGEWLIFLDADDFISTDFLDTAAQSKYQENDIILFQFAVYTVSDSAGSCVQENQNHVHNTIQAHYYQGDEMLSLIQRILVPSPLAEGCSLDFRTPCARVYKKEIILRYSIRFSPDIKIGEDLLFNLEYQLKAQSCVLIPKTVYFYDVHEDSSSHHFNSGLHENHARLLLAVRDVLDKNSRPTSLEHEYYSYALENLTYVLIKEIFNPHSPRRYWENRKLCQEMRHSTIYREAMKYNRTAGILPRRILVFFFRIRCWLLVKLISRVSYVYLERK